MNTHMIGKIIGETTAAAINVGYLLGGGYIYFKALAKAHPAIRLGVVTAYTYAAVYGAKKIKKFLVKKDNLNG